MKRIALTLIILFTAIVSASASEDGVLRILAIGNSFSEDALEQEFYPIAQAGGVKVIVGNMYIAGCSIPVLDQFELLGANEYNYQLYYVKDKLHLNEDGYRKMGPVQAAFLADGK